jgi:hypothetical protein
MEPKLIKTIASLTGVLALACTVSCVQAESPKSIMDRFPPAPGGPVDPSSPTGASKPATLNPYQQAGDDECLLAWNAKSVRAGACSNQGGYSYMEFTQLDWNQPTKIELQLKGSKGVVKATFKSTDRSNRSGDKLNLDFSSEQGYDLRMEGVSIENGRLPNLGYVVLAGNSGVCQPIVVGSPMACYKAAQNAPPYSDTIPLKPFRFKDGATIRVDGCELIATASDSYSSIASFAVLSKGGCQLGKDQVVSGETVSYDLRDERNYPNFTVRAK